jgi:hypothetical protein
MVSPSTTLSTEAGSQCADGGVGLRVGVGVAVGGTLVGVGVVVGGEGEGVGGVKGELAASKAARASAVGVGVGVGLPTQAPRIKFSAIRSTSNNLTGEITPLPPSFNKPS